MKAWENQSIIAVELDSESHKQHQKFLYVLVEEVLDPFVFGKNVFENYRLTPKETIEELRNRIVRELMSDHKLIEQLVEDNYKKVGLPLTKVVWLFTQRGEWVTRECGTSPECYGPGVWCVLNACTIDPTCGEGW